MLKDEDWRVRSAAMNACQGKGVPLYRMVNPEENVYKKCLNNVIVVAQIPPDAQTRGGEGRKCRANKAKIVDIIGDLCGEKIGLSTYDNNTTYEIGDEVFIPDFDYSEEECAPGFHFFLTLEEAQNY